MNILLLETQDTCRQVLDGIQGEVSEAVLLSSEEAFRDSAHVDVIVCAPGEDRSLIDILLSWRAHPDTCLVPCWIVSEEKAFAQRCLWPRLTADRFDPEITLKSFVGWIADVGEWQQNRTRLEPQGALKDQSAIELAVSLVLRKASGGLSVFDDLGNEGLMLLHDGCLVDATVKHLRGAEAFFEFFSWTRGAWLWDAYQTPQSTDDAPPLQTLLREALALVSDANLLFHFVPDMGSRIARTESESALDDSSIPHFAGIKALYGLIGGNVSVSEILQASTLSSPRTMSSLAKWFSMSDIRMSELQDAPPAPAPATVPTPAPVEALEIVPEPVLEPALAASDKRRRLMIVDDSRLMRRALGEIFSQDPSFEVVGFAGDGIEALETMGAVQPDVITLDIQMPRMDGLTTLKHIMIRSPKPVVVVSAFTRETSRLTYEAFRYGAVDVLAKPAGNDMAAIERGARELRERVAQAARVRIEAAQYVRRKSNGAGAHAPSSGSGTGCSGGDFLTVVCGAGGFSLLLKVFFALSAMHDTPSVLCSTALSARAVDALVPCLAADCGTAVTPLSPPGGILSPGVSLVSSQEHWFRPVQINGEVTAEMVGTNGSAGPFDAMLSGTAELLGNRAVAVVISGEGEDGLEGMRRIRDAGGKAFVLSPEMCLKQDLPRRILEEGCAVEMKTVTALVSELFVGWREGCGAAGRNRAGDSLAGNAH